MKAKLEIEMDSAAFAEDWQAELARILRNAADNLDLGNGIAGRMRLRDINGNTVGYLTTEGVK